MRYVGLVLLGIGVLVAVALLTTIEAPYAYVILSVSMGVISLWIVCVNFAIVYLFRQHGRRGSLVPIIGGVFGAAGCLIAPWPVLNSLWWFPPLIDLGCIPMLLALVGKIVIPRR